MKSFKEFPFFPHQTHTEIVKKNFQHSRERWHIQQVNWETCNRFFFALVKWKTSLYTLLGERWRQHKTQQKEFELLINKEKSRLKLDHLHISHDGVNNLLFAQERRIRVVDMMKSQKSQVWVSLLLAKLILQEVLFLNLYLIKLPKTFLELKLKIKFTFFERFMSHKKFSLATPTKNI